MTDILEEIKEDLKYERYAYLWKKYGSYLVVVSVAVVLSTAAGVWYKQHQVSISQAEGSKLFKALQYRSSAKADEANALYNEVIQGKASNMAAMAALAQAMTLAKAGKIDEAKPLFLETAAQGDYPPEFRQLAELMYVYFTMGQLTDKNENADIISRLESLSGDKKIWKYNTKELLAFYRLDTGEKDKAKDLFTELKNDVNTPVSIRKRATEILEMMG
jgi:hypothetical protein